MNNEIFNGGKMEKWTGYTVYCKNCTASDGTGLGPNANKAQATRAFKEFGWAFRGGSWLCPTCATSKQETQ